MTKQEYILNLVALMKIANNADIDPGSREIAGDSEAPEWLTELDSETRRDLQSKHHDAMWRIVGSLIGEENMDEWSEAGYDESMLAEYLAPHNVDLVSVRTDNDTRDTLVRLENVNDCVRYDLESHRDPSKRIHVTFSRYPGSRRGSLEVLVGHEERDRMMGEILDTITAWNH